jgi:hypothetical protein
MRLDDARRRARVAKTGLAVVAIASFGAAAALARTGAAGHQKRPLRELSAPSDFVSVVRQNLLQSGLAAPAVASPTAATSVS